MDRRFFIKCSIGLSALTLINRSSAADDSSPRILLRSSWQTVNIGDIAHTPGILRLLEQHIPEAKVTLWPMVIDFGVDEMLREHFPNLQIVGRDISLEKAFETCDFLLHGSGANLVARSDVEDWKNKTGKPYGIYGITLSPQDSYRTTPTPLESLQRTVGIFNEAAFVFMRDSASVDFVQSLGGDSKIIDFAPDAAFAFDLTDDEKGRAFLNAHDLEGDRFLCCIPRLRYSPYWRIPSKNQELDSEKHARNEEMKEHDNAPLRAAIVRAVEELGLKVLVCPEDRTQMEVGKEMIIDKLPQSVRSNVVWRKDYWRTDEALSVYRSSRGMFSNDLHSPIMCIGSGTPAIVCRWKEQTTKALMWNDIGLEDWLFDFDREDDVEAVPAAVVEMASNRNFARSQVLRAQDIVKERQTYSMRVLRKSLGLGNVSQERVNT